MQSTEARLPWRIVQARGRCNRLPNAEERRILGLWARENGLRLEI